jgi:hypothetical protein
MYRVLALCQPAGVRYHHADRDWSARKFKTWGVLRVFEVTAAGKTIVINKWVYASVRASDTRREIDGIVEMSLITAPTTCRL